MDLNHPEIIQALLAARSGNLQVNILVSLILDLFMEVEALREALIKIDGSLLEPAADEAKGGSVLNLAKSTYQRAYLDAAFETHNNEGEYGGLDRLLARFYPSSADDLGRTWRECLLLERLGFSANEIDEYKTMAQAAEMSS
ncbi:MAG TPA: hypothetical protein VLA93_18170 [Pyrinomonadaceae bacterium]|nr:hypothetical protein [Pyrinomonadaceae bacterium]